MSRDTRIRLQAVCAAFAVAFAAPQGFAQVSRGAAIPPGACIAAGGVRLCTDAPRERVADLIVDLATYRQALGTALGAMFGQRVSVPPVDVWLFWHWPDYEAWARRHAPRLARNGGYYDGAAGRIVSYLHNNSRRLYHHELVHAAMGGLLGDPLFVRYARAGWPVWFEEGLAEYLARARHHGDRLELGVINEARLAYLLNAMRQGTLPRLAELLEATPRDFTGSLMNLYYSASWGWVYFLSHETPWRGRWGVFLSALRTGASGIVAFQRAFGADLDALELAWLHWLESAAHRGGARELTATLLGKVHDQDVLEIDAGEQATYLVDAVPLSDAFDVVFRFDATPGTRAVGLVLGNYDPNQYPYRLVVDLGRAGLTVRQMNGPQTGEWMASRPAAVPAGRHELRVQMRGGVLSVQLDGGPPTRVRRVKVPFSLAGFYAQDGHVRVERLTFRPVALAQVPAGVGVWLAWRGRALGARGTGFNAATFPSPSSGSSGAGATGGPRRDPFVFQAH